MTNIDYKTILNTIDGIRSFNGKINFANENLNRLGSGSGRIVYDIDNDKVLKLAKNSKGIAQNAEEINLGTDYYAIHTVAEVYEHADNDSWLIAQKAKKVSEKRIKELTEIPSLNQLFYYLRNFLSENSGRGKIFAQDSVIVDELINNEFVMNLVDFVINYDQSVGDMGRPSTYGEVLKDGQPSIILVDYGLNDEIYNTHYSRDKKKHNVYEQYQLDEDNSITIPLNIDGRKIDEKLISFIEKRNKYPKKMIDGIPHILDGFHECVNNLKETLDGVENKKMFYENLLKLQEYLISNGLYNREPLNEMNIARDDSDKIAEIIADKYNYEQPQYIASGSFGSAYDIGDNTILKVTSDKSEAVENLDLIGKPLKYIAKPYYIFSIKSKTNKQELFAIILEKLKTDAQNFIRIRDRLNFVFDQIIGIDYPDLIDYYVYGYNEINNVDENNIKKYFSKNPEDASFFYGILKIAEEAKQYNVESMDYLNPYNLGYKEDGSLGFFDLGFGNYHSSSNNKPIDIQIDERKLSSMEGSSTVNVKTKCKLGGQGNTSKACNQGDINNLIIKPLDESRRVLSPDDYKKITDNQIVGYGNDISNLITKDNNKKYLSSEDHDNILHFYLSIENNRPRYINIFGYEKINDFISFLTEKLQIVGIIKEQDEDKPNPSIIYITQLWNMLPERIRNNKVYINWFNKAKNNRITKKEWEHFHYLLKNGESMYNGDRLTTKNESLDEEYLGNYPLKDTKSVEVFKNPKSIKRMSSNIRGFVISNGDFFVVNDGFFTMHSDFRDWLRNNGYSNEISSDILTNVHKGVPVQRFYDSDRFYFSSNVNKDDMLKHKDEIIEMLTKAKRKNPTVKFVFRYVNELDVYSSQEAKNVDFNKYDEIVIEENNDK